MDLIEEIEKKIEGRDPMHSTVVMVDLLVDARDEIKRLRGALMGVRVAIARDEDIEGAHRVAHEALEQ